jgi:hypothetical protein
MAKVGAQRAAELTGRSKSTVQRAMNTGKLSFEVDANGRRVVDVSELDRAFGLAPQGVERGNNNDDTVQAEMEKAAQALEAERFKMRIRMLEDQLDTTRVNLEDVKAQRDQWQRQAQQVLLTSQYSQKQAEEYKEKLEQQQRSILQRRQQMAEQQQQRRGQPQQPAPAQAAVPPSSAQPARTAGSNENRKDGPFEQQRRALTINSLWGKLRGGNAPTADAVKTTVKDDKVA